MFVHMDTRGVLTASFKQMRKFLTVAAGVFLLGVVYILAAEPQYESDAQLLVNFGSDARPEAGAGDARASSLSMDEKHGLIDANISILTGRDLAIQLLNDTGIATAYPKLAGNPPQDMPLLDAALKKLGKDLTAKGNGDSGTITIGLYNSDPQVAADMLRRLIDMFQKRQMEVYSNPQIAALHEQAANANAALDEANKKLYDYKNAAGITALDEELTLLLKQRGDLAGYLARRQTTDTVTTSHALPARIEMNGDTGRFPVIEDIQKHLDELHAQEAALLQTYMPDSTQVQTVRRSIASQTAALNASVGAINTQIADLDKQIAEKHNLKAELENLNRQVSYAESEYKSAVEREHNAEINNDLNQRKITRISVIEQPTVAYKPTRPNKPLVLLLAALIGIALGVAVSMAAEIMDRTASRPEQLAVPLGLPVLAGLQRRGRRGTAHFTPTELGALHQKLLAALANNDDARVICLASSYDGEGTTTVAAELGEFVARTGKRVLVVTDNLARVRLAKTAPATKITLNDADTQTLEQAITSVVAAPGALSFARIVFGSPSTPMTDTGRLQSALQTLKHGFDLILITAPGILTMPSRAGLSQIADGTILIVEAARTRLPAAQQAALTLRQLNARLTGLILNKQRHYIPNWLYKSL